MQVITEKTGMDKLIHQVVDTPKGNGAATNCCTG